MKDIHGWFELTYASYLTLPRSVLQSMPDEWQDKFVTLLEELQETAAKYGIETPQYTVQSRDSQRRFIRDPYRNYDRGSRNVFTETNPLSLQKEETE